MIKPKCPNCQNSEFVNEPIAMDNGECWNPVFCTKCGAIVGQLPSNDEKEAIKRIAKVLTIEEDLQKALALLYALEKKA
jgi:hypothetical protein